MYKFLKIISIFTLFGATSYNGEIRNTNIISGGLFNVYVIDVDEMEFAVSETKPKNADFYINSNFFTTDADPIGLVVIDRKSKSRRVDGGGYFYVKNGKPYVSSKNCPYMTDYASQTILWGIDNGVVNERLLKKSHANLKRYRTLMGVNKEGDIVVISSNRIGLVTIKELIDFSMEYDLVDGILLDGGTSVDYKFTDEYGTTEFRSVPLGLKGPLSIDEPTTYIYGNFK